MISMEEELLGENPCHANISDLQAIGQATELPMPDYARLDASSRKSSSSADRKQVELIVQQKQQSQ